MYYGGAEDGRLHTEASRDHAHLKQFIGDQIRRTEKDICNDREQVEIMRGILNGSHSLDQLSDRTLFVKQAEQQPRHVPKTSSKVRITVDIETNTEAELEEKPSPNRSRVIKALKDIRISNARKKETRITQSVLKERIVALPFMENRSDSKDEYVIANHRVQKKGIRIIQNDFHEQADDVRKSRRAGLHEKTALLIDQYQKKQEPFPLETFARRNVKSIAKIG